jgi:hypothetical protein
MAGRKKRKNIPIATILFIIIPILVVIIALTKIATKEPDYVYVKVKVAQGLWWAAFTKPNMWYTKAITKGVKEYDLLGEPIAEILEARYYQTEDSSIHADKFDIYFTVNLSADYNKRTQKYTFKRSDLVVGAPISLNTPSVQITGTVMEISEQKFDDRYEEKIITLTKKLAQPWEYDAIKIGDKYFDGEEIIFEILTKHQYPTAALTSNWYGSTSPYLSESLRYITIKAKIKVKARDGKLFYGEEKTLSSGKSFVVAIDNYNLHGYVISKIE